jgi:ATP-dependent protease HslVU (ClpYQ) peptidase subunit
MSTLVVVRKEKKVVIGSDSLFSQGSIKISDQYKLNHLKIHSINGAYIGFVGWSLYHSVFEDIVERYSEELIFNSRKTIFSTFRFLHEKLKEDYQFLTTEKNDQPVESSQWDCLIASSGGIFSVDSYRTINEYQKFWADGSGMRFALGGMHASYDYFSDPVKIAEAGLNASCEFDDGSGFPIYTYGLDLK